MRIGNISVMVIGVLFIAVVLFSGNEMNTASVTLATEVQNFSTENDRLETVTATLEDMVGIQTTIDANNIVAQTVTETSSWWKPW